MEEKYNRDTLVFKRLQKKEGVTQFDRIYRLFSLLLIGP